MESKSNGVGSKSDVGVGSKSNVGVESNSNIGVESKSNVDVESKSNVVVESKYNVGVESKSNIAAKGKSNIPVASLDNNNQGTSVDSKTKEKDGTISRIQRVLTAEEEVKLEHIHENFLRYVVNSETVVDMDIDVSSLQGLINYSLYLVNDYVKFMKTIDEFRSLSMDTQTACLKAHLLSTSVLRSVYTFNPTSRTFDALGRSTHEVLVLEAFSTHTDVAERFIKFCKDTQKEIPSDSKLHVILQMILVFSPDGDELLKRRHLSNIQDQYLILLKHYLESTLPFIDSSKMYGYLLQKIQEVKECSAAMLAVLHEINPATVEPLLQEVYDIK